MAARSVRSESPRPRAATPSKLAIQRVALSLDRAATTSPVAGVEGDPNDGLRAAEPGRQGGEQARAEPAARKGQSQDGFAASFHPSAFLSEAFSVDSFVAVHRKKVVLPQLRTDLAAYLELLKASMVELINKDYADFVSLSSNLVGLDRALGRLSEPLAHVQRDVLVVKEELDGEIGVLQAKLRERERTRESKVLLQRLLNIAASVEKIESLLGTGPAEGGHPDSPTTENGLRSSEAVVGPKLIERVASEFNQLQFFVTQCKGLPFVQHIRPRIIAITDTLQAGLQQTFQQGFEAEDTDMLRQCLRTYAIIDKVPDAEGLFRQLVVQPFAAEWISRQSLEADGLPTMYRRLLDFVAERCGPILQATRSDGGMPVTPSSSSASSSSAGSGRAPDGAASMLAVRGFDFLVNAVWTEFVDSITSRIPQVFSPAVASDFHKNYLCTQQFIADFERLCGTRASVQRLRRHAAFALFKKRWTLPVYFQLRFQEIAGSFESCLREGLAPGRAAPDSEFSFPELAAVCNAIRRCWGDDVFIRALTHRFWKLSLQIVARFATWLANCTSDAPDLPHAVVMSVLNEVSAKLLGKVQALFEEVVFPKVEDSSSGIKATSCLQDALQDSLKKLEGAIESARDSVVEQLSSDCGERLAAAKQVKDQYHYRNREAPTEASAYIAGALDPVARFLEDNKALLAKDNPGLWARKIVSAGCGRLFDIIEDVLSKVKKQEESLRRLKSKSKGAGLSDYQKMRMQFVLDVQALGEQIEQVGLDPASVHAFGRLQTRLAEPAEANGGTGSSDPSPTAAPADEQPGLRNDGTAATGAADAGAAAAPDPGPGEELEHARGTVHAI